MHYKATNHLTIIVFMSKTKRYRVYTKNLYKVILEYLLSYLILYYDIKSFFGLIFFIIGQFEYETLYFIFVINI